MFGQWGVAILKKKTDVYNNILCRDLPTRPYQGWLGRPGRKSPAMGWLGIADQAAKYFAGPAAEFNTSTFTVVYIT